MEFKILLTFISLFFVITFLQSGFDKLMHQEGNIAWFKSQFKDTFIAPIITPMFWIITLQELICGGLLIYGCIELYLHKSSDILLLGFFLSFSTLIQLFFGQRIAKDYVGASGIIPYIIVSILAIIISMAFRFY